jgi:hypothetical protein
MTPDNRKRLHDILMQQSKRRYPNIPDHTRKIKIPSDRTANGLTQLVIMYINGIGGFARRINTMGRVIDKRKTVTDVVGRQKTIGSMTYIPTTGVCGSADISGLFMGKSYEIEVKIGKDRQSIHQKAYQDNIERNKGVYMIVRSFDHFLEQWERYNNA